MRKAFRKKLTLKATEVNPELAEKIKGAKKKTPVKTT
jgi:hypothetical protein